MQRGSGDARGGGDFVMEQARSLCLGESEWAPIRALKRVLVVLSLPVASTTTILGPSQTVKTQGARHASPTLAKEKINEKKERANSIRLRNLL